MPKKILAIPSKQVHSITNYPVSKLAGATQNALVL